MSSSLGLRHRVRGTWKTGCGGVGLSSISAEEGEGGGRRREEEEEEEEEEHRGPRSVLAEEPEDEDGSSSSSSSSGGAGSSSFSPFSESFLEDAHLCEPPSHAGSSRTVPSTSILRFTSLHSA